MPAFGDSQVTKVLDSPDPEAYDAATGADPERMAVMIPWLPEPGEDDKDRKRWPIWVAIAVFFLILLVGAAVLLLR